MMIRDGKKIIKLREEGRTFSDIQKILGHGIPKSTISYWARKATLSPEAKKSLQDNISGKLVLAREKALLVLKARRHRYLKEIEDSHKYLRKIVKNQKVSKIALAMLYLGEGGKTRSSVMFGNSDPNTIRLFMDLLRRCYKLDESKFRCTVQCRADQNTGELERFWSALTHIKSKQFYKTNVDPRTHGKISKNKNYKGVCRIDYFSARIDHELKVVASILQEGR